MSVSQGVNVIRKSWSHQTTWRWKKWQPIYYIYIYIHTHVHCTCIYIYVKPPDEYPWQGRNSFNSGIFVIFKKLWTLNYRSPLLSSQFLPALMLKSSLTVYIFFGLYPSLIVWIYSKIFFVYSNMIQYTLCPLYFNSLYLCILSKKTFVIFPNKVLYGYWTKQIFCCQKEYKDMLPSQCKDWRKEHEWIYVMVY